MSISVQRRLLDSQKVEVVTLTDKFGSTHIVQHSLAQLVTPGYDKTAVEAEAIAMMEANEQAWENVQKGGQ